MLAKPCLQGRRVVVIEDDPLVKATVETCLSESGAVIVPYFDLKLDAAILDVKIGRGVTSLPIAKTLELRGIPFLFYTAYGDTLAPTIQRRWPHCTILSKPVSENTLIQAVASLLEPQRLRA